MKGNYPFYTVNHFDDYKQCLQTVTRQYADKTLFVTYDPDGNEHSYTYKRFGEDVAALSASLLSLSCAGKHIALIGENSYEWMVSLYAITTLGGVAVTVDTEQSDEAIVAMVRRADAVAVLCGRGYIPLFHGDKRARLGLEHVILLDGDEENGFLSFDTLVENGRLRTWMSDKITIDPDQPAMIVYTSGTTNTSKPVLLTHRNMMSNACNASSMVDMGARVFTSLPLYHTYALTAGMNAHLIRGATICINGSLKTMMRDLVLYNPTAVTAVPLVMEAIWGRIRMELKKRGQAAQAEQYAVARKSTAVRQGPPEPSPFMDAVRTVLGKNIELIVCGGAYLNAKVADDMEAFGVQIIEGYGITECSPMISANRNRAATPHSAGLIMPDMEVEIVDDEIWVRGVSVSNGYYNDPELTAEFFEDGWFKTGDMGSIDRNGFLFISGRKKNLVVFKNGKKVMPEEIEGYVAGIPLIRECMAYGVSTGDANDDVKLGLMVYPNPDLTADMQSYEILQKVQEAIEPINGKLPAYKQIQIVKIKETPFEKTALKKIKRHIV